MQHYGYFYKLLNSATEFEILGYLRSLSFRLTYQLGLSCIFKHAA